MKKIFLAVILATFVAGCYGLEITYTPEEKVAFDALCTKHGGTPRTHEGTNKGGGKRYRILVCDWPIPEEFQSLAGTKSLSLSKYQVKENGLWISTDDSDELFIQACLSLDGEHYPQEYVGRYCQIDRKIYKELNLIEAFE